MFQISTLLWEQSDCKNYISKSLEDEEKAIIFNKKKSIISHCCNKHGKEEWNLEIIIKEVINIVKISVVGNVLFM